MGDSFVFFSRTSASLNYSCYTLFYHFEHLQYILFASTLSGMKLAPPACMVTLMPLYSCDFNFFDVLIRYSLQL